MIIEKNFAMWPNKVTRSKLVIFEMLKMEKKYSCSNAYYGIFKSKLNCSGVVLINYAIFADTTTTKKLTICCNNQTKRSEFS